MQSAAGLGAVAALLGVGAYAYAAMWPTSQLFGETIIAGNDPDEFALTYDDGPNEPHTQQLLDVLAAQKVHASFFLIGEFVRQRPQIVRAIQAAGHLVGNHTMTHPRLLFESPARVRQQLAECNAALEDTLGQPVRYFRPPYGARRPDVLRAARELGLKPVLWNAVGRDWKTGVTAAQIRSRLQSGIRRNRARGAGSNLLLHDGGHAALGRDRSQTVAATSSLIPGAKSEGARFVRVDAWG